jgi:hypothetical protein
MIRMQDEGRSHNIQIDSSYLESMEQFKYLETTLTDQNSIHEKLRAD